MAKKVIIDLDLCGQAIRDAVLNESTVEGVTLSDALDPTPIAEPISSADAPTIVISPVDAELNGSSVNPVQNRIIVIALAGKQPLLISGTNIKTINNQSILGEGNISISGGGGEGTSDYEALNNLPSIGGVTLVGNKTLAQLGITNITELTVSGWGFTKNTGTYNKPSGGIPETDLASAVQTSLSLADSALQESDIIDTLDDLSSDKPISARAVNEDLVDFVDGSINDTLFYIDQEIQDEYAGRTAGDSILDEKITTINNKIPTQASSSNQLADKAFVNSSVQTATSNFRGNWNTFAAVPSDESQYPTDYSGVKTPTTNDYMVVQEDENHNNQTWRYKYGGDWATDGKNGWHAEYEVNRQPLTAVQIAALNSGATAALISQISANQTAIAGKQATISDLESIRTGAGLGATALQSESDPTVPSWVKSITQTNINTWNGKQDSISDLSSIRSGAGLGATALQPSALSGYATQTWVNEQGFLTEHQDISGLQSKLSTASGYSATGTQVLTNQRGTLTWIAYTAILSGTSSPSSTQGNNGDLYLQTS